MLGTVLNSPDGVPVARVLPTLEAVVHVGPDSDHGRVVAFVDALLGDRAGRLRSVCDNRDDFALRPATSTALAQFGAALGFACGAERDPAAADWTVAAYYDVTAPADVPDVVASCAFGRVDPATGGAAAALCLGIADAAPWVDLCDRALALAQEWPGLWRWMTLGYRFCPLTYNDLSMAHWQIRRAAPRIPAADVGDTLGLHTTYWTTRLRTVSWATFVAPDLAARCGPGLRRPATDVEVRALADGGACVRVRGEPAPADTRRYVPRGFAEADTLLRAARARDDVVFLPPWDSDSTRDWLERWQMLPPSAPSRPGDGGHA